MTRIGEPWAGVDEPAAEHAGPPTTPVLKPMSRWPSWLPAACTFVAVASVIVVTLWQMHFTLLFTNTTTTGGDTGSHVVMPAYLRSHLLSSGRLTGWDPSWYDGYPIYTFYFVLADLLAALGSFVIHYNVAFKLVTVLGSLLMPIGAWWCGKLFGLRAPGPAALAVATLPFLFDYTWTIDGGNLFSTLAGEYAYALAIPLALVFLGLFARGLRTGKGRGWAAVVLALCIVCHIVPAFLALVGAFLLLVMELLGPLVRADDGEEPQRSGRWRVGVLWWALSTVALGLLLCSWWLVPFVLDHAYSTQMGYENVTTYGALLFPQADWWALLIAGVGVVVALLARSRFGLLFSVLGGLSAVGLIVDPQSALYNVRLLPLWFLCVYLMVGWVVAVGIRVAATELRDRWDWYLALRSPTVVRQHRFAPGSVAGPLLATLGALAVVIPPFIIPQSLLPSVNGPNQVTNWAQWNYLGYQGAPAWPEFHGLMDTMTKVGHEHGCGRAMWEYDSDTENAMGTTEALMDLAYFTGGCVDSMEGLLFESSATTPYHFSDQSELSPEPSDPFVDENDQYGPLYGPLDIPLGIEHLQLLGVRYFMAFSPVVVDAAEADPSLRLIATSGPWHVDYLGEHVVTWDIFQVTDSAPVASLTNLPAVMTNVSAGQDSWLKPSVDWYEDAADWDVELAAGGPANWPRIKAGQQPPTDPVVPTTVSKIEEGTDTISFHVGRLGTPVLVKTSYFPNWVVHGAQGPWRVTPNLMVVVPTSHTVTLTYGLGKAGKLGYALTLVGVLVLVGLGVLALRRRRAGATRPPPSAPAPSTPQGWEEPQPG